MRIFFFLITLVNSLALSAQLNRFPYIQSTTQNSTIIAWKTANDAVGKVAYGLSASQLNDTLFETSAVKRHAISLKNLTPDTAYFYRIFSGNTPLATEYFKTAKGSSDQEFSFIQYGDCGYNSAVQAQIGGLMEADDAEFAVVCGDIDQGGIPHVSQSAGGDNYDDIFFNIYNNGTTTKMLSHECHYTAIGNHDVYANNGATYELEFHLPHNNIDSSERYYSFEWGDAKFIALDVITPFDPTSFPINQKPLSQRWWTDFRPGSAQYDFLVNELQCNDKKWVFIYFHEGPWTNYWGGDYYIPTALGGDYYMFGGNTMVRQHIVPVFEQYNVDFVMVGHSHLYEQAEKNGVMYITSGGAGDVSGNTVYNNHPEILKSIVQNMYVKYTVDNNTVSYDVINKDNIVIDSFSLTKAYTAYEVNSIITQPTCFGGNDGTVSLVIQGPKPPYTIAWFDGSTGNSKSGLAAGTYYAYVKNAYDCEKVVELTLTNPPALSLTVSSDNNSFSFCEGDSLAIFPNAAYASYLWNTGKTDSSIYVSQAGFYNLIVVDTNGCSANVQNIQVIERTNPNANFGFANNNASFNFLCPDINVDQYYWDFGDGNSANTSINASFNIYANNGTYTVTLIAVNGCDSDIVSKVVIVNSYPTDTTGIQSIYVSDALQIVPNPFSSSAKLIVSGLGVNLQLEIYNLIGELVRLEQFSGSSFLLESRSLASGTYFIKVSSQDGKHAYAKIVIN
jgi:hypothetical protein